MRRNAKAVIGAIIVSALAEPINWLIGEALDSYSEDRPDWLDWALTAAGAVVPDIPPHLFLSFAAGATFAFVLLRGWRPFRPLEPTQSRHTPVYEVWDKLDQLELWQAACLWAGREPDPASRLPPGEPQAWATKLKRAVLNSEIKLRPREERAMMSSAIFNIDRDKLAEGVDVVPDRVALERRELLDYAEAIGEKPPFLYPNQRR